MGQHLDNGLEVHRTTIQANKSSDPPSVGDIAVSLWPIQDADYVIFVGDDGSVWEIKNRFGQYAAHPARLA